MVDKEYIIFCDESDRFGAFYSNFYGGVIVGSSHYEGVVRRLEKKKGNLNLHKEVKWSKVSEPYLKKYSQLIESFFDEIKAGKIKVRIMFRQNSKTPKNLTLEQKDKTYFLLYYQFIKHAFGLLNMPSTNHLVRMRLYFDQFPDTRNTAAEFKEFLFKLNSLFTNEGKQIFIPKEEITEVSSRDHVLIQCLDIVLGSMAFRLNDKHRAKLPGTKRRGCKTIAKENLYKAILNEISAIHPKFNIGISTGIKNDLTRKWSDPYLHWCFEPAEWERGKFPTKQELKRKRPASST